MKVATVREAQHHLSRLLAEVAEGEEILLTRRGRSVGRLVPPEPSGDPFLAAVDWMQAIQERDESLSSLPCLSKNPVLESRESQRY